MKREIKFRGKRIDNGEWVYGDLVRVPKNSGDYNNPPSSELITYITDSNKITYEWVEVIPESVGQFTGLLDKNGKEIYEGDILDFEPYEWNRSSWTDKKDWEYPKWLVEWDNEEGKWNTGGGTTRECSIYKSIIGNIHENPELLK